MLDTESDIAAHTAVILGFDPRIDLSLRAGWSGAVPLQPGSGGATRHTILGSSPRMTEE
jgi:hypothetical protein